MTKQSKQIQELYNSLNAKQKRYTNFDLPNPKNGEYMLAVYHLIPGGKLNMLQAAAEVAAESYLKRGRLSPYHIRICKQAPRSAFRRGRCRQRAALDRKSPVSIPSAPPAVW